MDDEDEFTPLARHIMTHLVEVQDCEVSFTAETAIDVTGPFDIEELASAVRAFYSPGSTR